MTVQEILNMPFMDVNKLDSKELRKLVKQLTNVTRKRVSVLTKEDNLNKFGKSPALKKLEKEGGFSIPRKATTNQLKSIFIREKKFLQSKTSSITGLKKYEKEIAQRTGTKFDKWDIKDKKIVWDMIDQIREYEPNYFVAGYESERSINTIMNYYEDEASFNLEDVYKHLSEVIKQENIDDDDFFL